MMCAELAGRLRMRVQQVQHLRHQTEFDFTEIFSGPNFPLTKAVGSLTLEVKKAVLVPRAAREEAVSSTQAKLGRVGV